MAKLAVLGFLIMGCSALRTQISQKAKDPKITYSLKVKDQAISNKKLNKEDLKKIKDEHTTGAMKDVGPIDEYLEMWYVNTKKAKDRRQCMDKQMEEMGVKPHVFKALEFQRCISAADENLVECLKNTQNDDCVKKGLNPQAIATHGSASNSDLVRRYHIVSNACSHKRMMSEMLKRHTESKSKAKYAILLEDDVAFDRKDFVRKVVNFAETYDGKMNSTWQMVQIDPFGSKCDRHIVGYFEGLPVWKPKDVNVFSECSNYWGAQALLIKFDAIPMIVKHMETHPTVPLDWLPAEMEQGLAWHANIAKNPEETNQYYAGEMHHQYVKFPDYCKKSVTASTIGDA